MQLRLIIIKIRNLNIYLIKIKSKFVIRGITLDQKNI